MLHHVRAGALFDQQKGWVGMSNYSSQLRDTRWQKKRLELLEAANWSCCNCGSETRELQCHHLIYRKGKSPWEYPNSEIIVLCSQCHEYITKIQSEVNERILTYNAQMPGYSDAIHVILGFLDGMCGKTARSIKEESLAPYCNGIAHADYGKKSFRDKYHDAKDKVLGCAKVGEA